VRPTVTGTAVLLLSAKIHLHNGNETK
jgi:hypothetical protein